MSLRSQIRSMRNAWWLRGCEWKGDSAYLHGRPSINLEGGRMRIGRRCAIRSAPVTSHFVAGPNALLDIGDDVFIGHGAAIAAYEHVRIGPGTRIAPFAIVMDTNFHEGAGNQAVQHDCRPVLIGSECRVGSRVTIMRGVSIGDGAEILAGSVVTASIPAGACAGGARARVLGAAGEPSTRWDSAAALGPLAMVETFGLSSTPPLHSVLAELPEWDPKGISRFVAYLVRSYGERFAAPDLAGCRTVEDLVRALEAAADRRSRQQQSHGRQ